MFKLVLLFVLLRDVGMIRSVWLACQIIDVQKSVLYFTSVGALHMSSYFKLLTILAFVNKTGNDEICTLLPNPYN